LFSSKRKFRRELDLFFEKAREHHMVLRIEKKVKHSACFRQVEKSLLKNRIELTVEFVIFVIFLEFFSY
jgi:hypothetical protein